MTLFPAQHWQHFQTITLLDPLLEALPDLRELRQWPDISDWQTRADALRIWDRLPQRLEFERQKVLGQRAKRKQKNRTRYEVAIMDQGKIPTRAENLHDFFNALIWLRYPRAKWTLHRCAYESLLDADAQPAPGTRNELCDRLTCFDEGGIVLRLPSGSDLQAARALIAGREQDKKRAFCEAHRDRFHIFGHGILEVLFAGADSLFASCALIEEDGRSLDEALADYLRAFNDQGGIDVRWLC